MATKLIVAIVVIPFDRGVLESAVHPLDLSIGPRMVRFGQSVFNLIRRTDHVEAHRPRIGCVPVSGLVCELDPVVRKNGMYFVQNGFERVFKKLPRCLAVCFVDQLRDGAFAGPINGYEEIELAFLRSHLGNVDVEIADWISFEPLPLGFVACDIGQSGYSMPLQTSMQ